MKMNEICFYMKLYVSSMHLYKTTTTLCVQTVDTCHTCQEISAKTCNLDMYDTFFGEYKWFLVHLAVSVTIYVIFYKFQILLTFTKTPPCIRWLL